jgi:hypothetical protein
VRAALLARVSDESQAESDRHSLPAQLRAMRERCAREGWEVAATFEAPGESASTRFIDRRPVLRALVNEARAGAFDVVLFHESSRLARDEEGLRFVRFGVWVKPNSAPQFTGDRPAQGWEAVAILHGEGERPRWNAGGDRAVWQFPRARGGSHPAEKPIALIRRWIADFTDPGDLILDPFMGSGTVLRAAKDLGRQAIGIEIDRRWCEHAAARLSQAVMPGMGEPVAAREDGGEAVELFAMGGER